MVINTFGHRKHSPSRSDGFPDIRWSVSVTFHGLARPGPGRWDFRYVAAVDGLEQLGSRQSGRDGIADQHVGPVCPGVGGGFEVAVGVGFKPLGQLFQGEGRPAQELVARIGSAACGGPAEFGNLHREPSGGHRMAGKKARRVGDGLADVTMELADFFKGVG